MTQISTNFVQEGILFFSGTHQSARHLYLGENAETATHVFLQAKSQGERGKQQGNKAQSRNPKFLKLSIGVLQKDLNFTCLEDRKCGEFPMRKYRNISKYAMSRKT